MKIRKTAVADIKGIHAALLKASEAGLLLPRSLSQLYAHCRDFHVIEDANGVITGCCALSIVWDDLAEIRSLFLEEELRGRGLGRMLVDVCLAEAKKLGIRRVFTLTYQTGFFIRMGFAEVGKDVLPQKIWADCIHCPKFPECDEIAMLKAI
jgi:amino-acid N-acetyltransferase